MIPAERADLTLAVVLVALAGFVDAVGFLVLGGLFVSFMSGNSTQFAIGTGRMDWMSARQLHLVFEPSGTTFSRHVQRRRLEECRAALIANPARSVTDVAFAWGFTSLSSFYRAFQAAFGMAPRDLREAESAPGSPLGGYASRAAAE